MYCWIFGRWWETSIGPVMLNHPILRSNEWACIFCSRFPSQQHDPCQGIHHSCCCAVLPRLCLLSSQLQLQFATSGHGLRMTSPATPSDGKANLPGSQTHSIVLAGSLWQFQPCQWPAGVRKSSELEAGRSSVSQQDGGEVEFALLNHELARLSALGPWTWVYLPGMSFRKEALGYSNSCLFENYQWCPKTVWTPSLQRQGLWLTKFQALMKFWYIRISWIPPQPQLLWAGLARIINWFGISSLDARNVSKYFVTLKAIVSLFIAQFSCLNPILNTWQLFISFFSQVED